MSNGHEVSVNQPAEWHVHATSTSGGSTGVKRTGEAGKRHLCTSIIVSYTGAGSEGTVTLNDGTSAVMQLTVHEDIDIEFSAPVRMGVGNDMEVTLSASGSATGRVTVFGYTAENIEHYRALASTS